MQYKQKMHHVHVTLLDIFIGVLVHAVLLAALAVEPEEAADGHPRLVVLVEEAAGVALHAEASEPVSAHRLTEAPPSRAEIAPRGGRVSYEGRSPGAHGGHVGVAGRGSGGGIGLHDVGPRGDGGVGSGTGVEAALEVEAENPLRVLH